MGSPLSVYGDNSGRFWAAAESQGSNRSYGDAYGTYYNPNPTLNNQYDSTATCTRSTSPVAPARRTSTSTTRLLRGRRPEGHGGSLDPVECDQLAGHVDLLHPVVGAPTPLDYTDDVQVARRGPSSRTSAAVDKSAALRNTQAQLAEPTRSGACPTARWTRTTTTGGR